MAVMRPSCPPPRMPIVPPGAMVCPVSALMSPPAVAALLIPSWAFRHCLGLFMAIAIQPLAQRRVVQGNDRRRQQGGIGRPGLADGKRADRDAGRHLDDGIEAVL